MRRRYKQGVRYVFFVFTPLLLSLAGCIHQPQSSREIITVTESRPPVFEDDTALDGLACALRAQRERLLQGASGPMTFGDRTVERGAYVAALDGLTTLLESNRSHGEKLDYIRTNFDFVQPCTGRQCGEILLTGYFEPVIEGSRSPTATHSQPLYARPADLVRAGAGSSEPPRGRIVDGKLVPYYTRAEIDGAGTLAGRGLELCWVDPIDAFFLHIQGSGTVRLPDGTEMYLNFAEKNGHPYEAIGKQLRAKIAPRKITMEGIKQILRELPANDQKDVIFTNPSYIFFRIGSERAVTSMGVPATAGRTIAVDPSVIPRGFVAVITLPQPVVTETKDRLFGYLSTRVVVAQDTGSAIKGPRRVDLFTGRGDEAGALAGVLQEEGTIWYLVPKQTTAPQADDSESRSN